MPIEYKKPGLYITETVSFPASIPEAATAIPVFIGHTEKTGEQNPKQVRSLVEYQTDFGEVAGATDNFCLYESVKLFFDNGGRQCFIISTGNYSTPVSFTGLNNGLINARDLAAALLAIPDAIYLSTAELSLLQQNMLQQCAELRTRFAILDTKEPSTNIPADIEQFRDGIGNDNLSWGAAYYPWLITDTGKKIPPSGAIAGVYAKTDIERGVWKAPVNISLNTVAGLTNIITDTLQQDMNVTPTGKSVNAIRSFRGKGFVVWGARTLMGNDNEWRYVPVKRFFMMVEESVKNATEQFVFEPNDANTWVKVKGMIENYLILKWREGALVGQTPKDAFAVNVGLGSTMTVQDIMEGRMIVMVLMAMLRPAEFIILQFSIKMLAES